MIIDYGSGKSTMPRFPNDDDFVNYLKTINAHIQVIRVARMLNVRRQTLTGERKEDRLLFR